MSRIVLPPGAISSVFIGVYGASSILTRFPYMRTNGITIVDQTPSIELPCLNYDFTQSDWHKVSFSINFNSIDDNVIRISKGLSLTADINNAPGFTDYVVLLLGSNTTSASYLFPKIRTLKNLSINNQKTSPTTVPVEFRASDRNMYHDLIFKDTPAALSTRLGVTSPL